MTNNYNKMTEKIKIKGIKPESLEKIVKVFYQEHKEILDVWQELLITAQTDIEVQAEDQQEQE